jgi:cytochrome P450
VGPHLARVEAQVAIAGLVRRSGRLRLLDDPPVRHDSVHRRGLVALPIAL